MDVLTIHELADRYGLRSAVVMQALAQVGFAALSPDSPVTTEAAARFEARFGDKARALRPKPPLAFTAETDAAPAAVPARARREPPPHLMRVAHDQVTGKREGGRPVKALLDSPGLVHAIDPVGTQDGDPWRGLPAPGAVHFYGGGVGTGPPAACGTKVRAVLGVEFVPPEDADDRDAATRLGQCPKCARVVAEGRGFRDPPGEYYRPYFCERYLRVRIDDKVEVQDCYLRDSHRGPHRTRDGAEWSIGFDDFVPAPLDAARRITKAS